MAMLANVHMVSHVDDDDDLYSGFGTEEVAPALQTEDLEFDEGFQVGGVFTGGGEAIQQKVYGCPSR